MSDVKKIYILRHAKTGIIVGVGWDDKKLVRSLGMMITDIPQLDNYVLTQFLVERPDDWDVSNGTFAVTGDNRVFPLNSEHHGDEDE